MTDIPLTIFSWKSWKQFLIAWISGAFFVVIVSRAVGVRGPINIFWTVIWFYLTIMAWKPWKYKAILPIVVFYLISILSSFFLISIGGDPQIYKIILSAINLGGLVFFSIELSKAYSRLREKAAILRANEKYINTRKISKNPLKKTQDMVPNKTNTTKDSASKQSSETLQGLKVEDIEISDEQSDDLYEKALDEYETSATQKAAMAKAIVEADGDSSREKATYIKLRVQKLRNDLKFTLFEERKKYIEQEKAEQEKEKERIKVINEREVIKKLGKEGLIIGDMTFHSIEDGIKAIIRIKEEIKELSKQALSGDTTIASIKRGMSYDDIINELQVKIDEKKNEIRKIESVFKPISKA